MYISYWLFIGIIYKLEGPCGVMINVVRNGHGDPSSNPSRVYLHFTYPWERYEFNYSPSSYGKTVGQTWLFNLGLATGLEEGKL